MQVDQIKEGTPVIYWAVIDGPNRSQPLRTEITSPAWTLGSGEIVCSVKGVTGGVAISHLDTISPGSLLAAKLQGCKDVSNEDFIQSSQKFFSDRGVNVQIHVE